MFGGHLYSKRQMSRIEAHNFKVLKAKIFRMKILNFWHGQLFVYFSQTSHLEASNTETAQSKDVWNEYLESNYI